MTTASQPDPEALYQLRKAMAIEGPELLQGHPWVWEAERWKELVFALLTRIITVSEQEARELTERFFDLGLLGVHTLAAIHDPLVDPVARRMRELMTELDVSEEQADVAVMTVIEAAHGLEEHHQGKVQRYLRLYGELMIREIDQNFHFTRMNSMAITEAFVYWLQNVLNMPLPLNDDGVRAFCARYDLTPSELYDAADQTGLNLGLVDDLAQLHIARNPTE